MAQTTTKKIIVLATRATNNNTNNKADFYKADVAVHTYVYVCVMKSFSRLRLRMRVVASLHITVIYIFSYSCCCIFHCKHIYTHISIYRCNIFVFMYYILATSNMLHKDAALANNKYFNVAKVTFQLTSMHFCYACAHCAGFTNTNAKINATIHTHVHTEAAYD